MDAIPASSCRGSGGNVHMGFSARDFLQGPICTVLSARAYLYGPIGTGLIGMGGLLAEACDELPIRSLGCF